MLIADSFEVAALALMLLVAGVAMVWDGLRVLRRPRKKGGAR